MAKTNLTRETKQFIFDSALKEFYDTDSTTQSRIKLVVGLLGSDKGKMWVAEQIFGKPIQTTEIIAVTEQGEKNNTNTPILSWV